VERRGRSPIFTGIGIVAVAYMVGMTAWGYRSLVPVYIVVATAIFVGLLEFATGHREGRAS
jgi:quinol-cytochrome oxidoreductase complex cytochrome b subunit